MNRAYRIVWSAARQAWIVASENAGSGGVPPHAVKKVAGALLLLGVAGAAVAATYSETQVNNGDILLIQNTESAKYTSVLSGGIVAVNSGGSAYSTVVSSGGLFSAVDGSSASNLQINAGGILQASTGASIDGNNANGAFSISGGNAKYVLLDNDGLLGVRSGDSSFATVVNSGGAEIVYGTASGTTVNAGGMQGINQGGTAEGTVVNSGGTQEVAGMTSATVLTSGGLQIIQNAGSAYDTLADTGSEQDVISGGTVQSVLMSGTQNVWGTATDTTVYAGGKQNVLLGGNAVQTTVTQGAWQSYRTAVQPHRLLQGRAGRSPLPAEAQSRVPIEAMVWRWLTVVFYWPLTGPLSMTRCLHPGQYFRPQPGRPLPAPMLLVLSRLLMVRLKMCCWTTVAC